MSNPPYSYGPECCLPYARSCPSSYHTPRPVLCSSLSRRDLRRPFSLPPLKFKVCNWRTNRFKRLQSNRLDFDLLQFDNKEHTIAPITTQTTRRLVVQSDHDLARFPFLSSLRTPRSDAWLPRASHPSWTAHYSLVTGGIVPGAVIVRDSKGVWRRVNEERIS
jgi:hypothetical protein